MGVCWWVSFVCTLALAQADCTLPVFDAGVVGSGLCTSGGILPTALSCNISCNANYTATAGSPTYTCTGTMLTATPTLTCALSCFVDLPRNLVGMGASPCPRSGFLARGASCAAQCDSANNFTTAFTGNNGTYSCSGAGNFQATTLRCTPCVLPNPLPQTNIDTTTGCQAGATLAASESCNVVCNSNYTLSGGNSQYTCGATGVFTPSQVVCQAQACAMPTLRANVVRGTCPNPGQTINPGTDCTVQCAAGYIPSGGNGTVHCNSRFAEGSSLMCAPAPCNVSLAGAGVETAVDSCVLGSTIQSGQSCSLKCLSGYQPSGSSLNAVCTAGRLDLQIDCERVSCAFPSEYDTGVVAGATRPCVLGSTLDDGDTCNLRCDTGYSPQADKTFTCHQGAITAAAPAFSWCTPNPCNINNYPQNMQSDALGPHSRACSTSQSLPSGSVCDVKCDNVTFFASIVGNFYFSCFAGEIVNAPTGQCLRAGGCYFPPLDESYALSGSCNGGPLANNTACSVGCANGYAGNASLSNAFYCANGQLTNPARVCTPAPCTLPTLANGVTGCVSGGSLASNSSCTMACGPGYMLSDAGLAGAQYSCSYGALTQSRNFSPNNFCIPLACVIPNILPVSYAFGGAIFGRCTAGQTLSNNTACAITCAAGWKGANGNLECQNGVLTPLFTCAYSDCRYTVPAATAGWQGSGSGVCNQSCVVAQGAQTLTSGTCCEYKCAQGYTTAAGASTVTCQTPSTTGCTGGLCDATPTNPNLLCVANPCKLPPILGGVGVVDGGCIAGGNLTGTGAGSACAVACDTGYAQVNGSTQYACNLGNLTVATLVCEERNCTLPNTLRNQLSGQTAGPNNSSCTSSGVLLSGSKCDVECKAPLNESVNGGTRTYSCLRSVRTDPTLVCVSNTQCALPIAYKTGYVPGAAPGCQFPGFLNNNANCRVACAPGYSAVNDANVNDLTYSCANGVLDPALVTCVPSNCTVSIASPEVTGNCTNGLTLLSNASCVSTCETGFTQTSIVRSCALGVLNVSGECTPASCQLPASSGLGQRLAGPCVLGGQIASGVSCDLECQFGYTSVGPATGRVSCSFGNLSFPALTCLPTNCTYPLLPVRGEIGDNATEKPCMPQQLVTDGDFCYETCAVGWTGADAYPRSCSLGTLSARNPCVASFCFMPELGANVVSTCPTDTLPAGEACSVGCDPAGIYTTIAVPDRSRITCSTRAELSEYGLQCFPVPCSLPYSFGNNVNLTAGTCTPASRLDSGSSCTIACSIGYSLSPAQNSFSCRAGLLTEAGTCVKPGVECVVPDFTLSAYYEGESEGDVFACSPGQVLTSGASCRVGCATDFTANAGTRIYSCSAGVLMSPNLVCTGPPCTLPIFTQGITSTECATGGSLAYGASCTVSCAGPAFSPRNTGTTKYTCGARLLAPLLQCVSIPCDMPDLVPASLRIVGTCRANGTLPVGRNCAVQCANGYRQNGTGVTSYSCAQGTPLGAFPTLGSPTVQCLPNHCTLATPLVAGFEVVSCPPNSTSAECMVKCAAGFNSVLATGVVGRVTATCTVNGGTFVLAGCNADRLCGVSVNQAGYSVTCNSPSTPSNCVGTVCAPGYYGSPMAFCTVQNGNMRFTGCAACRSSCPAGLSALPCNSSHQPPCTNCSANTFNNGTNISCTPCPYGTCSPPGASSCAPCPPQQVTIAGDSGGISAGALAAAIIVPLLIIILIIAICYISKKRKDGNSIASLAKSRAAHKESEMSSSPSEPIPRTDSNLNNGSRKQTEVLEMERGNDGLWRQKSKP